MEIVSLVGLVTFTVGLAAIVFPRRIAELLPVPRGVEADRATVAVRGVGFVLAIGGVALLL